MARKNQRARKIRRSNEFDVAQLTGRLFPPSNGQGVHAWNLEAIRNARDAQLMGRFELPARMAEAMRTDDALFVAHNNRLAPQRCVGVAIRPANASSDSKKIAREAEALFGEKGIAITTETLASVHSCLANHGVAFGALVHSPRADGARIDLELHYWPIEHCYWDSHERCYMTRVEGAAPIPIIHGNGRWVVFSKHAHEPWKQDACILPAALVWARHAFANRDWSRGSTAHGNAKVVGTMPEGMALQDDSGNLTAEAQAFMDLLAAVASVDTPVGMKPFGSTLDYITNNSTAWQVWSELVLNAEKAAARIYLGTDGTLGASGGAPGVDVTALFGVAATIVQGDLTAIERALLTGMIEPWCAINFGSSALAPQRVYLVPDADADAEREAYAKRFEAFQSAVKSLRENGFGVDQDAVNELAMRYAITAPLLPKENAKAPTITLAPTDIARVVRVNEARASAGLGPLMLPSGAADPDGLLTVEEFSAKKARAFAAPPPPPAAPSKPPAAAPVTSPQG